MPPQPSVDSPSRNRDRLIGGILWGVIALLIAGGLGDALIKLGGAQRMRSLANYWLNRDAVLQLPAAPGLVAVGDPVFFHDPADGWKRVGFVQSISRPADIPADSGPAASAAGRKEPGRASGPGDSFAEPWYVTLRWHDAQIDPHGCRLIAYRNRGTLAEMLQVMFPVEKRLVIQELIAEAMRQHGDALSDRFFPLVQASVRQSLPVVEAEFMAALQRHQEELSRLGLRWKEELLRERLLPLAREQLLPIARRHAEPTIRAIGRELWDRASLWSFTWRAAYDKTPLPRRNLMREEWERFIREEAIPVIEAHSDQLAVAIQRTLAEVMRSPRVRDELLSAASLLANDRETRALIGTLLRETLVENEAVRRVWIDVWTGQDAELAYDFASDLLGPLVHKIGEEMLGSPQRGIDPGLARLLRHQVLGKDRRWIVATEADGLQAAPAVISRGVGQPIYPLLHLADQSADR